jgi:hypothetical protein
MNSLRRMLQRRRDELRRLLGLRTLSSGTTNTSQSQITQVVDPDLIITNFTINIRNIGTNQSTYKQTINSKSYPTTFNDGWYIIPEETLPNTPLSAVVTSNGLMFSLKNWSKYIYLYRDDGTLLVDNIPSTSYSNIFSKYNYYEFQPIEYEVKYYQLRSEPLPTTSYIRIITKSNNIISEKMYPYDTAPIQLGPYQKDDTIVIYFAYNTYNYLPNLFIDKDRSKLSNAMGYQRNLNYTNMNVYKYTFTDGSIDTFYLIPSQKLPTRFFSYRDNRQPNIQDISFNTDCNKIPENNGYTLLPTNNLNDYNVFTGDGIYVNLFTDFECKVKANESDSVQKTSLFGYNTNTFPYVEYQNAKYYKLYDEETPIIQPQMYDTIDGSGQRIYINPDNPSLCMPLPYESTEYDFTSTNNNGYDISYYTDPNCTNQYIDAQYNVDNNQINNTLYTPTNINGDIIENSNALFFRVYKQP